MKARAVEATRQAASAMLMALAAVGLRSICDSDVPMSSQTAWISTIIATSTASLTETDSPSAPANTAAIASQALGLATASSSPPAKEGATVRSPGLASGGAVAILNARYMM